ncbi:MAG: ATP-binding cassette domain-containing protein [Phycisphaera sp.]|nr:ATP-binding cassette domain-containing protein [Phycisphaera sp.]
MTTATQNDTTSASAAGDKSAPLLEVEHLKTYFPVKRGLMKRTVGYVKAVDDVSFTVGHGETLGLVGESGCGKTTVGRTLLRLIPATGGSVRFDGTDVFDADRQTMQRLRRGMQIIFQDPVGSLNPRMTVGRIVGEPIQVHGLASGSALTDRVADLLNRVGLSPDYATRYPHEFSGGQRQRIGIARALGLKPKFIVCDEPVSALDVSIQSQVLNLLNDLQDEFGLAYLFVAHNLAVVEHFSDRVAVMYLGRIVEVADRDTLYADPRHPYTHALLSAVPLPKPIVEKKRIVLQGEVPSPSNPPSGCHFHPRCPLARTLAENAGGSDTVQIRINGESHTLMAKCVNESPTLDRIGGEDASHCAACHFSEEAKR